MNQKTKNNRKYRWYKPVAWLLVIMLCAAMLPVNAFSAETEVAVAEENENDPTVESQTDAGFEDAEIPDDTAANDIESVEDQLRDDSIDDSSENDTLSEEVSEQSAEPDEEFGLLEESKSVAEEELFAFEDDSSEEFEIYNANAATTGTIQPAEGATIQYSGKCGTCTWEIYSDGTLIVRPTKGKEGTMKSLSGKESGSPWHDYWIYINRAAFTGTIHAGKKLSYLFSGCYILSSVDLSGLDTSNVTDMKYMFGDCNALSSVDVSHFDTSNVINMSGMFSSCNKLKKIDVSHFDTRNVTDMSCMFDQCSSLKSLDVSGFDTRNVTNMGGMFGECSSLKSLDVSHFETGKVTNMCGMFVDCTGLTSLDISGFDTSKVTKMHYMLSGLKLKKLDLRNFNTKNVELMRGLFAYCKELKSVNLSSFNTSKVTDMSQLFEDCSSLTSVDLSGFDTRNVTDMACMFENCSSLTKLDVSGFDTSSLTNLNATFAGCSGLTSLKLKNFNTGKVTNMGLMFSGCSRLTSLDLSRFNINNVNNMQGMFSGCSSLTYLDLSCFNTGKVIDMGRMFSGCTSLGKLIINFDLTKIMGNDYYARFPVKMYKIADTSFSSPYATESRIPAGSNTFVIKSWKSLKNATVSVKNQTYSGKDLKPAPTVKLYGKKLTAGTDYTVSYKNNKNVGKATVTITGKGNYSGSKKVTFNIKPKGTSISGVTAGSKALEVKWKKQATKMSTARITGYQIQIATNSGFTANKKTVTVEGYSNVSKEITGLKGNKKYYVRIRTYKTLSGKNYYSAWSEVKTATTEK